jgi:predicted ribosome quality control (RQC) complex YloA/Tae2 family protein
MDVFYIEAVVLELMGKLAGARVNKVHQPNRDDIILRLWTGREEVRLLLSASPTLSRIHLTGRNWPNPFTPPRFCQLLRSRLSVVAGIEQIPGERVVRIRFLGKGGACELMVELLGRHSNIVLTDGNGIIVDVLKRVSGGEGKNRGLLPGVPYCPPLRSCPVLLGEASVKIPEAVGTGDGFEKWLLGNVSPMSPLAAADLAAGVREGLSPENVLSLFRERWLRKDFRPLVALWRGKKILFALDPQWLALEEKRPYSSFSEAAEDFYYPRAFREGDVGDRSVLEEVVRKGLKRLSSRKQKILGEQKDEEDIENRRRIGEVLLVNLHIVRKGINEIVLEDCFQDPPVPIKIALDPSLTPQQNAERYFKGFKKEKRGVGHRARRLEETSRELEWLEGVALALEEAETPGELTAIQEELETAGLVPPVQGPAARRPTGHPKPQVNSASSPGGYRLFWGKNNRSNDYVSGRLTGPEDLWFHAHNLPGSHLVLRKGEKKGEVPEEDIKFAAVLAAGYSRGKNDGKVEVMVTEGKWVRKAKGLPPGMVLVDCFRTLVVPPRRLGEGSKLKNED